MRLTVRNKRKTREEIQISDRPSAEPIFTKKFALHRFQAPYQESRRVNLPSPIIQLEIHRKLEARAAE